ncbi:tetraspanin-33-like [Asbolus verrucosus]|uniref:Tetraspanin-33-like n=1 Tax=Asbolus verrucosus TaxID=1661398 RepID=A0A482VMK6_ASBVE|nr:tetraspanin-33-like [Asbolus verrucosus]
MKFTANENVLRVALIVFSIVFGILSISLIALGVVYIDELWWPRRYIGLDFLELPTLLIILGSLSLLMAIAGCLCAKTYNRNLLLAFGGILFIILCLELAVAVIAFINFEKHEDGHTKTHSLMLEQYFSGKEEDRIEFKKIEDHH